MNTTNQDLKEIEFLGDSKYINGHICLKYENEIRLVFIEEKLSQKDGNLVIKRNGVNQIVMSKETAKDIIKSLTEALKEN